MSQDKNIQKHKAFIEEDEIDLIALAKTLWQGRKIVLKITLFFMVIGLFVAVFSEEEYRASTTFVPQAQESKIGGNLGGLAAMAGINLGGMSSGTEISPSLYPQIMESIPFQLELLKTPLSIEGKSKKISFENYYLNIYRLSLLGKIKKYTIGLPGLLISTIKDRYKENKPEGIEKEKSIISITEEESELIERLTDQVFLEVNEDDGFVTVSVNMPKAIYSAELAYKVQELLQQYVIDFKIKKSKEQLKFIKLRYSEIEEKFKIIQQKLAKNRDRNQNVTTAMAKINSEILQDEYNLVYGVYTELAKQLEAQYIQVTKDTPVFTVLKPVTIPIEKSKPKRGIVLISWILVGLFISIGVIFGKEVLFLLKNKWDHLSIKK